MTSLPTHQVPEVWDRAQPAYDEFVRPFSERVGELVLDAADPVPGEHFLDLGAGTGAMAERAIRRPDLVVAVDFAPRMIETLSSRIEGVYGKEHIDWVLASHVMDAHTLSFDAEHFGSVGSNLSLPYFRDVPVVLGQIRRILWNRGRLAISTIADAGHKALLAPVFNAIWSVDPGYLPPEPTSAPSLFSEAELESLLQAAGFGEISFASHEVAFPIEDPARYWRQWALDTPSTAGIFGTIDAATREAAEGAFVAELMTRKAGGAISIPVEVLITKARRIGDFERPAGLAGLRLVGHPAVDGVSEGRGLKRTTGPL